ncbi:aminoglycoside phosphotransferase family protein [Microbacterium sp. 2FI]|uniref:aminoglycoside phosphotransferase family protein n=1 Tax=Microbacterium sp. 2FI TaxID=2502193 RepID=UPI0010F80E5E|nr:aminoglycoside phosphotransferase family protein [Microbacterium sp. 2FI]
MPDKPAAEVIFDEALVRRLVTGQATALGLEFAALPLVRVAAGWDCEVWRLGDALAVRLPRRALAAPLVRSEQRALPVLGPRLAAIGVASPMPLLTGSPGAGFPWPWSIVAWIDGCRGLDVPRADRRGWANLLAAALGEVHIPAPTDAPVNPVRGVPLAERADAVEARLARLRSEAALSVRQNARLTAIWRDGLDAAPWTGAPLWIHGDLHPGNLIADGGSLHGIIDFGDVTSGDPAYDLAVAWLAFDADGRDAFRRATAGRYDEDAWRRARAWAAAVAVMLLSHSDDAPAYAELAAATLLELEADPASLADGY